MFETVHTDVLRAPVVISLMLNLLFLCNIVRVLFMKLRAPAGPQGGAPSRNILQAFRYVRQITRHVLPFPLTLSASCTRCWRSIAHFFPRFNLRSISSTAFAFICIVCLFIVFTPFCPIGIFINLQYQIDGRKCNQINTCAQLNKNTQKRDREEKKMIILTSANGLFDDWHELSKAKAKCVLIFDEKLFDWRIQFGLRMKWIYFWF